MQRDKEMIIRIPKEREENFRLFIVLHGGQIVDSDDIKHLEIYREDYKPLQFNEMLSSLGLNNDEVGEAFMISGTVKL
ncbi:MAG: hypothetical protein IJA10_10660 [Lachnospiraceae bacterium]|nr:hypothetical protein [Lachnospiraceae bacterium]